MEELEAAVERVQATPELEGRAKLSAVFKPGGPGSLDDRVVQTFIHTDICSSGSLALGQQFELQVRLDL